MQDIESKLHILLKEIADEVYSDNEQSKIVAYATSLFKSRFKNKRLASNMDEKIVNAYMNDVILKAMASLNDWDDCSDEVVDCSGLNTNQALRKIAQNTKNKWGTQEILNPEALSYLDFDIDDIDSEQKLLNGDNQTEEGLKTPGVGRHRSDFTINNPN
jgi:hypothetical protein